LFCRSDELIIDHVEIPVMFFWGVVLVEKPEAFYLVDAESVVFQWIAVSS